MRVWQWILTCWKVQSDHTSLSIQIFHLWFQNCYPSDVGARLGLSVRVRGKRQSRRKTLFIHRISVTWGDSTFLGQTTNTTPPTHHHTTIHLHTTTYPHPHHTTRQHHHYLTLTHHHHHHGAEEVWFSGLEEGRVKLGADEVWCFGTEEVWFFGAEEVWFLGRRRVGWSWASVQKN